MTDKASIEIPSPVTGRVRSLGARPGEMVAVGAVLVWFAVVGDAAVAEPIAAPPAAKTEPAPPPGRTQRVLASPSVRRRGVELGIDLRDVRGSGPGGRVEHRDLDSP